MVGGGIVVKYEPDGASVIAAQPGDYVYPGDVRVSSGNDRLYVKAHGAAGGIREETWLYEYDLRARKQLARQLVAPDVLPPECPMPEAAGY